MHIQGLPCPSMSHGPDEPPLGPCPGLWSWPISILREVPNARAVAAPVPPDVRFLSGEVRQALPASLLSPPGEPLPLPTLISREPPLARCLGQHSGKTKSYRSCIQVPTRFSMVASQAEWGQSLEPSNTVAPLLSCHPLQPHLWGVGTEQKGSFKYMEVHCKPYFIYHYQWKPIICHSGGERSSCMLKESELFK